VRRAAFIAALAIGGLVALELIVLIGLFSTGTVKSYAVASPAMEPTLHCARPRAGCEASRHDRVLVLTRFVSYERGDVVAYGPPSEAERRCGVGGPYVMRIVGVPGDTVELRPVDDVIQVYVDGRRIEEPYVESDRRTGRDEGAPLPQDHFLLLGDNRAQSCDSRTFGPAHEDDLIGEIIAVYWPPERASFR
jgi:signal peptidase I